MNEKVLLKISLIGFLISITALYVVTQNMVTKHVNIGDINSHFIGKNVNITGTVIGVRNLKGHMFLTLEDHTGKIKVIFWNDTLKYLHMKGVKLNEIKNGVHMNVIGSVQSYRGELEVIAIPKYIKII